MKRLLTILSILICSQSFSQIYQAQNGYGFQYRRLKPDSTLHIPTFCGVPTLRGSVIGNQAAIGVDSCNHKFYFYDPKDSSWSVITGGGIPTSGGIDSVTYSSNQLCQWVNGVSTCYRLNKFFDSTSYNSDSSKYLFFNNGTVRDSIPTGKTVINLHYPLYWNAADTSINSRGDSLIDVLKYAPSVDSLDYDGKTLIPKEYLEARIAAFVTGGITRAELQDTAAAIRAYSYPLVGNPSGFLTSSSITGKLNISDTASMLSPYISTAVANATFATITNLGLKADKATTITINGTTQDLSTNRSWTVSGGTPTDTTSLSNRINQKLNISDTATMLSSYIRNLTVTTSGSIYPSSINATVSGNTLSLPLTLNSQSAYTLFGRGSGSGTPAFLSSIDSNWVAGLHTEGYYNTRYAGVAGSGWSLIGNTGTSSSTNFLGTTDNTDFVMKRNGATKLILTANGTEIEGVAGVENTKTFVLRGRSDVPTRTIYFIPSSPSLQTIGFTGGLGVSFVGGTSYKFDAPVFDLNITTNGAGPRIYKGVAYDPIGSVQKSIAISYQASTISAGSSGGAGFTSGINTVAPADKTTYAGVFSNVSTVSGTGERYGIQVTGGAKNYFDGAITIGSSTVPTNSLLNVAGTTQVSHPNPNMTTAQRDAITGVSAGDTIFCTDCTATDSSTGVTQTYNGSTWKNLW